MRHLTTTALRALGYAKDWIDRLEEQLAEDRGPLFRPISEREAKLNEALRAFWEAGSNPEVALCREDGSFEVMTGEVAKARGLWPGPLAGVTVYLSDYSDVVLVGPGKIGFLHAARGTMRGVVA